MSRCLTVVDPGPLTTVQDRGRFGWRHLGLPRARAQDRPAAALGSRLVGTVAAAAELETTLGGVAV
ncbi:MAG: allophanate hydrolase subunit 2 family protein, partial [Nocardioidaceae bacterium]